MADSNGQDGAAGRPGRGASRRGTTPSAAARGLTAAPKRAKPAAKRVKPAAKRVKPAAKRVEPAAPSQHAQRPSATPGAASVDGLFVFVGELARQVFGPDVEQRAEQAAAFLRRRITGDYRVDPFGFDEELTDTVLLPLLRPLYRYWFRVEVRGIQNVPAEGGALVVANHSGTIPLDSLMTQIAVHDEHPAHRHLRMLGADLVFQLPFLADVARKSGTTLACNEDAERLLRSGEVVGVWPEGFKGIGKPFAERYKLQRFGRGGFVSAAIRSRVPIVPCSIVGAEEIYPLIANLGTLARVVGLPYVPVTPTFPWLGPLGLVPLPSKWIIEFGEPIPTDQYAAGTAEDPMLVFDLTDRVRETIQQTLRTLLASRHRTFF
jgi:1-acyl-sn-glycerol-3-phosphate acyltransferase